MSSISKRRKTKDRISNLPTELTNHILSFLPIESAVQTRILSTRWNQKWALVTPLDSFTLTYCPPDFGVPYICRKLSAALSQHVREVELHVPMDHTGRLQHNCLFSSRTLVVLKLGSGFVLVVPKKISLESLKTLHFNNVEFESNESFSRLISSCPVLEELEMDGRLNERMNVIKISSVSLKRLILMQLYFPEDPEFKRGALKPLPFEVVLRTPNLEYLELSDYGVPAGGYNVHTLHRLDSARLNLPLPFYLYFDKTLTRPMAELAEAISNVRFLYLSDYAFEAFCYACCEVPNCELPKFPRLTILEFESNPSCADMRLLTAFLESSPQLASLSFAPNQHVPWYPPADVPFCMLYNLKVIELTWIMGTEVDFNIVKYFLEKTKCLEEFIIPNQCGIFSAEIIKKIVMLPMVSESCKLVLT